MTGGAAITIVKDFESLIGGEPSSVTRMVKTFVPGVASLAVQRKSPFAGSIEAPLGAPGSRPNVSEFAGMSGSVTAAVKVTKLFG